MLVCSIRRRRAHLGLSQTALADRVGVSRQALGAIEAGRQVPSTTLALQLARALGCSVDELFRLAGGATLRARAAGELRAGERVLLGRVADALVAHRCARTRGADGVVLEGGEDEAVVELLGDPATIERRALVAGCAPLLGPLTDRVARHGQTEAAWVGASSGEALALLQRGLVHAAGIHWSADLAEHRRAARAALPGQRVSLVHVARWLQGLVVAAGNPLGIRVGSELGRPGLRVARRQAGAAAQRLLERLLPEESPQRSGPLAADHREVAELVRWGVADVGVAIEAAARDAGLAFMPVADERFDLVVPADRLALPAVARLIEGLGDPLFRREVSGLPGYDLSSAGELTPVEAA